MGITPQTGNQQGNREGLYLFEILEKVYSFIETSLQNLGNKPLNLSPFLFLLSATKSCLQI